MKKKTNDFDEYYEDDFMAVARKDNLIIQKSKFSVMEKKQNLLLFASQYDNMKSEIDRLIVKIVEDIQKCDPLKLLIYATDIGMMNLINTVSEIQVVGNQNFQLRAPEYIQSILVSCGKYETHVDFQEDLYKSVLDKINELYEKIIFFYTAWGAKATIEDNGLTEQDVQYIIESQMMKNVRGNRYQSQQLNSLESLLVPHNTKIQEAYGISVDELMVGLKKLEKSLSSGKLDSMQELFQSWLDFREHAQSIKPEQAIELMSRLRDSEKLNPILGKSFGSDLYNVKLITGWDDRIINNLSLSLGESTDFFNDAQYSGWPIIDLPIQKKPFIKINGNSYCFDYHCLFDNIYRVIQKGIKQIDSSYTSKWSSIQQVASENLVEKIFKRLLPDSTTYVGNYYSHNGSSRNMDENDLIVLYDNTIIIVEVKAGSFTYTPAITDIDAHKKSFESLIYKADFQCERTLKYFNESSQITFYSDNKGKDVKLEIDRNKYDNIFTCCVTIDNFNTFASKIEKNQFFDIDSGTIALSVDELEVYAEYFDSALYFLHFLKNRKSATKVRNLLLSDELDHLGMYIIHNNYSMYANEFTGVDMLTGIGYREDLDAYFARLHNPSLKFDRPCQMIPEKIQEIVSFLETTKAINRVAFSNFLLDLDPESREIFSKSISHNLTRQPEIKRMIPSVCNGDIMYSCFVIQDNIELMDIALREKYIFANMLKLQKEICWYIVLTYKDDATLQNVEFRQLVICDIEKKDYDRSELLEFADTIFNNRVKAILQSCNKKKIGRNDPCPCGSGKKYKKCCINKN